MIKIKRGLDLPISGSPRQEIGDSHSTRSVAILGRDYVGMKPTMEVRVGDQVKLGQRLFTDKKTPGVVYTAPGAGTVAAINRGERRRLLSVVIDLDGDAEVNFRQLSDPELASLPVQEIVDTLVESGAWTALRTRPYSKVPDPLQRPRSLFVNVMDTNPLAVDPAVVLAEAGADFSRGVKALARLPENRLFICKRPGALPGLHAGDFPDNVVVEEFAGPHPAGLSGTHIHFLDPAGLRRQSWTINYQDVIAIGRQLASGRLSVERIVSLAGPQVEEPRLIRTRLGANLEELTVGEMLPGENRVISGSVLSGHRARGAKPIWAAIIYRSRRLKKAGGGNCWVICQPA